MPLIHNSPDPERHKKPMWRGWQLPELRPSLQESLEHLRNGGLGEVHIMDVVGTRLARTEKHVAAGKEPHHDQRGKGPAHRLPVDAGRSTPTATSRTSSWTGTGSARAWFPERSTTRPSSKPPGTGSEALRKDAELSLAEGAAKLGWDQLETAPGLHRFMDHVRQAGDQLQQCQRLRAGNVGGYHGASIGRAGARPFM